MKESPEKLGVPTSTVQIAALREPHGVPQAPSCVPQGGTAGEGGTRPRGVRGSPKWLQDAAAGATPFPIPTPTKRGGNLKAASPGTGSWGLGWGPRA